MELNCDKCQEVVLRLLMYDKFSMKVVKSATIHLDHLYQIVINRIKLSGYK